MPLTARAVLPVLLIVIVAALVAFTVTRPNVRLPLSPITFVGVGAETVNVTESEPA
jgi:hypothetical protein